jgi:hypothetical protein
VRHQPEPHRLLQFAPGQGRRAEMDYKNMDYRFLHIYYLHTAIPAAHQPQQEDVKWAR